MKEKSLKSLLPIIDATTERGVHNPRVVDLVYLDPGPSPGNSEETVVLSLLEFRPWENSPQQLEELEEKINNYADYVLDGHLFEQYPQYQGKRVCFQLRCLENPTGPALELVNAIQGFTDSCSIGFELVVGREGLE